MSGHSRGDSCSRDGSCERTEPHRTPIDRRAFLVRSALHSLGVALVGCRGAGATPTSPQDIPPFAWPDVRGRLEPPPRLTIEAGRSLALRATQRTRDGRARPATVAWESEDPRLATVDERGIARFADDFEGAVTFVGRRRDEEVRAHVRVQRPGAAREAATALAELLGSSSVRLILDAQTGLAHDDAGTVHQWQDARGPLYPTLTPVPDGPTMSRTADGAPCVRFDGVGQGLRSDARFDLATTRGACTVVLIGTTWGDGVPLLIGDVADGSSLGVTLRPNAARPFGKNGLVLGVSGLSETAVSNGPGDRAKSTRVRVHSATRAGEGLYASSPPGDHPPVPAAPAAGSMPLWLGRSPVGQFNADDLCAVLVLESWPDMPRILAWARERHGSVAGGPRLVLFAGDSLVNGLDLPDVRASFPNQLMERGSLREWDDVNVARGGTGIFQHLADAARDVDVHFDAARERNICVVMMGTNDIAIFDRDGAQAYADTRAYCAARRAAGWRVVVLSMIARRSHAGFESERQAYLALLRADHAFADAMVDVAADPRLGGPEAWMDTTWFADGVHPTPAGYALIADLLEPVLLGL